MTVLAFDWGGSSIKYGIWENESLGSQNTFPTPKTWEDLKFEMTKIVNQFKDTHELMGVAISSPGSVNSTTGIVGGISAIEYIHDFEIVKEMEALFNLPISIENDANCAALAEIWQGVAKDEQNVLFVVVGTGIGGAVVIDGEIQPGHNLFGGEFGCMILDGVETFSMLGTAVHMAERYAKTKQIDPQSVTGHDVFELAKQGDKVAIEEVEKFYGYLSLGLYNLQFVTDPSLIIIGGGVSQNETLIEELNIRVKSMLKNAGLESVAIEIKACHYLNDANLVGAIAAFQSQQGDVQI